MKRSRHHIQAKLSLLSAGRDAGEASPRTECDREQRKGGAREWNRRVGERSLQERERDRGTVTERAGDQLDPLGKRHEDKRQRGKQQQARKNRRSQNTSTTEVASTRLMSRTEAVKGSALASVATAHREKEHRDSASVEKIDTPRGGEVEAHPKVHAYSPVPVQADTSSSFQTSHLHAHRRADYLRLYTPSVAACTPRGTMAGLKSAMIGGASAPIRWMPLGRG